MHGCFADHQRLNELSKTNVVSLHEIYYDGIIVMFRRYCSQVVMAASLKKVYSAVCADCECMTLTLIDGQPIHVTDVAVTTKYF